MEREKKRSKIIHSTDSPYQAQQWPFAAAVDQQMILELLCELLRPLGEHRQEHANRSQGKRAKRQRRKKNKEAGNNVAQSVPPIPEVAPYITVGFNSTIRHLQLPTLQTSPVTSIAAGAEENLNPAKKMAAVFVCTSTLPALLTTAMPTLVAAASARQPSHTSIRLVSLPREAEKRLTKALFQPRVGFVGLLQDAPGGKGLVDMTMDRVSPLDVPWLRTDAQVEYRPVSIKTTTSL